MSLELDEITAAISAAPDLSSLEKLRVKYLGRSGVITRELRRIGELPQAERAAAGETANQVRSQVEEALRSAKQSLQLQTLHQESETITLDVTAPADVPGHGHGRRPQCSGGGRRGSRHGRCFHDLGNSLSRLILLS